MLRILGGELKGRTFTQPPGIRPAMQLVRSAIFDVLRDRVEGARVLELFAGSGALSFEALSRGAASAVLVEISPENVKTIRESARSLGILERTNVVRISAEDFFSKGPAVFDLIIMAPPYGYDLSDLTGLGNWLTLDGVLVVEYAGRTKQPTWSDLDEISARRYGDTRVGFYRTRVSQPSR